MTNIELTLKRREDALIAIIKNSAELIVLGDYEWYDISTAGLNDECKFLFYRFRLDYHPTTPYYVRFPEGD